VNRTLQNKSTIRDIAVEASSQHFPSHKKTAKKLQNRRIEKDLAVHSSTAPSAPEDRFDSIVAVLVARRKEQLLRLALVALGDSSLVDLDCIEEKGYSLDDSVSSTTRTTFLPSTSDEDSSVEDVSLVEGLACHGRCHRERDVRVARIGIDIGGVLLEEGQEVPGSCGALRAILKFFGASNVFLVSKVKENGRMHMKTRKWLDGPRGFLERSGLRTENVRFVSEIAGPKGKGVAANSLGLSHFIDDRWAVLQAVFSDEAGSIGDLVERHNGMLLHFATGSKPMRPKDMPSELEPYYRGVSGWPEALASLGVAESEISHSDEQEWMLKRKLQGAASKLQDGGTQPTSSIRADGIVAVASVVVHRIHVGIEDDAHFCAVHRLLGYNGENLKRIASSTGVKLVLSGRGSPHPQPQSLAKESLSVCIRAKPHEDIQEAVRLVERLIEDICQEYHRFHLTA